MWDILQPAGWKPPRGYANGVVARGRQVYLAGTIGWDASGSFAGEDFATQARQALGNIVVLLRAAGGGPEHIVRITWYLVDREEYRAAAPEVGRAFRELIGHYAIAMSAVEVSALLEPRARVEIEVTAVIPDA